MYVLSVITSQDDVSNLISWLMVSGLVTRTSKNAFCTNNYTHVVLDKVPTCYCTTTPLLNLVTPRQQIRHYSDIDQMFFPAHFRSTFCIFFFFLSTAFYSSLPLDGAMHWIKKVGCRYITYTYVCRSSTTPTCVAHPLRNLLSDVLITLTSYHAFIPLITETLVTAMVQNWPNSILGTSILLKSINPYKNLLS